MQDTITLVRFRLQAGKTLEDCLEVNAEIDAWARRQPDFRFRSLSQTDDGEWFIITYWGTPEAAAAAEVSFGEEMLAMCAPLMERDSIKVSVSRAYTMQPEGGQA